MESTQRSPSLSTLRPGITSCRSIRRRTRRSSQSGRNAVADHNSFPMPTSRSDQRSHGGELHRHAHVGTGGGPGWDDGRQRRAAGARLPDVPRSFGLHHLLGCQEPSPAQAGSHWRSAGGRSNQASFGSRRVSPSERTHGVLSFRTTRGRSPDHKTYPWVCGNLHCGEVPLTRAWTFALAVTIGCLLVSRAGRADATAFGSLLSRAWRTFLPPPDDIARAASWRLQLSADPRGSCTPFKSRSTTKTSKSLDSGKVYLKDKIRRLEERCDRRAAGCRRASSRRERRQRAAAYPRPTHRQLATCIAGSGRPGKLAVDSLCPGAEESDVAALRGARLRTKKCA